MLKDNIVLAKPSIENHVTVYLPGYKKECLLEHFIKLPHINFHWFLHGINKPFQEQNIHYFPVNNELFTNSMLSSQGVICGAGFETPAEALYLNKKLICLPIKKHYEQLCNAAALKELGVPIGLDADTPNFYSIINDWHTSEKSTNAKIEANNIRTTLQYVCNKYFAD